MGAAFLLSLHFLLAYTSSSRNSVVADEPFHLARGVGELFFRDLSFGVSHPPLINFINALPLLTIRDLKLPPRDLVLGSRGLDSSDRRKYFADLLLEKLNPDAKKLIERARIATIALSIILGLLVFLWAKKIYGPGSGLFALFLYSLDPNILAHASLATNDLGAALFICLALYFLARLLKSPNAINLFLAAFFLGLAQLSKHSAILLYPFYLLALFAAFHRWRKEKPELSWISLKPPSVFLNLWSFAIILAGSLIVIWAGYGFETGINWNFRPLFSSDICGFGRMSSSVKCAAIWLLSVIPLPPRTFYYGIARTLILSEQHENLLYFMGKNSQTGWFYYYPVLFLVKTPLSLLALLGLRIAWRKKIKSIDYFTSLILVWAPIWFAAVFIALNRKEIGIRHLLMIYPLIFVFVSGLVSGELFAGRSKRILLGVLVVWLLASSLANWPRYLTYFNEAVGGRRGGLKISVVGEDWGQDVSALSSLQKKHNLYPLFYQPYISTNPKSWGLEYENLNCSPARPGYYAIHLTQLKRKVRSEGLIDCINLLKPYPPRYKVNGTIWVWKVGEDSIPQSSGN